MSRKEELLDIDYARAYLNDFLNNGNPVTGFIGLQVIMQSHILDSLTVDMKTNNEILKKVKQAQNSERIALATLILNVRNSLAHCNASINETCLNLQNLLVMISKDTFSDYMFPYLVKIWITLNYI